MNVIKLEALVHRGRLCIAIRGRMDAHALAAARTVGGLVYSRTERCYYVPYASGVVEVLRRALAPFAETEVDEASFVRHQPKTEPVVVIPPGYTEELVIRRYSVTARLRSTIISRSSRHSFDTFIQGHARRSRRTISAVTCVIWWKNGG